MGNTIVPHAHPCPDSRQVETNYGPVIGRRLIHEGDKQVDAFQGIPYAKPPVGELRFKKPEPAEPWIDPKETKAFGPRGIQQDSGLFVKSKMGPVSEDNLTLNVFTPAWIPTNEKGFPVLVFIHGGAFVSDSCVKYGDINICKNLVTKDVVVVTLQYRLGYLGFWSTGCGKCPGNWALWDMTFALQWVKDNIGFFNGDASNVTIMGQSAGGDAVDLLSLSPHSRELFQKVIPMAGNASCTDWSIHGNAVESCRRLAAQHGIHSFHDTERYLSDCRNLPAMSFATTMMVDKPKSSEFSMELQIGPRIDGDFLPKSVEELRKEAPSKARMIGCCRSEGLLFGAFGGSNATFDNLEEIIAHLVQEKDHPNDFAKLRKQILTHVIDTSKDSHTKEEIQHALVELHSDLFLTIGTQRTVLECLEDATEPVYFYSFDYFNPKMLGLAGIRLPFKDATHCTELAYIFGVGIVCSFTYTEEDLRMLDLVTTLWTNFAKHGDPNGSDESPPALGEIKWLPATKDHPQRHLDINSKCEMSDLYKNGRPLLYIVGPTESPLVEDEAGDAATINATQM